MVGHKCNVIDTVGVALTI